MNILMVGPHKDKVNGGMSTVINDYISSEYLDEFKIYHLATVIPGSKLEKLLYGFKSIILMIYYLLFKDIDIVHIHSASGKSFFRKSIFLIIANKFKKYTIFHIHGGGFEEFYYEKSNTVRQNKISKILNRSNKIIVLSESWKEKISRITISDIQVVNNSVKCKVNNFYNKKSNKILFIGRLEDEKGIFDFIESAKEIVKYDNNVIFTICGDGKLKEVKSLLCKYRIENRFELLGWVDKKEIDRQLESSMLFILPSYKEAMPMSILEAMNCGVPIVSTNVGSIPEFVKNGINGELFIPGDIKQLSIIIKKMIDNADLRMKISNNNIKDIREKFDNEINHNIIRNIYIASKAKENI